MTQVVAVLVGLRAQNQRKPASFGLARLAQVNPLVTFSNKIS
jgi:hypothetical protein